MAGTTAVVMPVLDDWDALLALLSDLARTTVVARYHLVVVDDGSSIAPPGELADFAGRGCIRSVELIRLAVNLGHQRAIAVGLSAAANRDDVVSVIVMDSDGEDRPGDIATLLAESARHPGHIVLARRARRSEDLTFRLAYGAYKAIFRMLTGKTIDFGNFCLLPIEAVRSLVRMPELWNNLAAALMRSRLRLVRVPIDRGERLAGRSRMNLPALVLHGLSAMSVYADLILVRVLLAAGLAAVVAVLGLVAVIAIRFGASFAIPGWASEMFGDLLIILSQSVVVVVTTTLAVLGTRSQRSIMPAVDAANFVRERCELAAIPAPGVKGIAA